MTTRFKLLKVVAITIGLLVLASQAALLFHPTMGPGLLTDPFAATIIISAILLLIHSVAPLAKTTKRLAIASVVLLAVSAVLDRIGHALFSAAQCVNCEQVITGPGPVPPGTDIIVRYDWSQVTLENLTSTFGLGSYWPMIQEAQSYGLPLPPWLIVSAVGGVIAVTGFGLFFAVLGKLAVQHRRALTHLQLAKPAHT